MVTNLNKTKLCTNGRAGSGRGTINKPGGRSYKGGGEGTETE